MIHAKHGQVTIGGLDARDLAERFGTPLFVYDADELRASWRRIRGAFRYPATHVHFAAVCNPNLHLLALLRAQGAEASRQHAGRRLLRPPRRLRPRATSSSPGSNVGDDDLGYLLGAGVHVNVDSLDDLRRACAAAPGRSFGLRMHLEDVLPESRIGLRAAELDPALPHRAGGRVRASPRCTSTAGRTVSRSSATGRRSRS